MFFDTKVATFHSFMGIKSCALDVAFVDVLVRPLAYIEVI
jgi:hypothetical protein